MGGEYREFSRVNGWSWPPHPLQMVVWIVIFWFIFCFYGTMCSSFIVEIQIALYIIVSVLFFMEIMFIMITSTLDPGDYYVRLKNAKCHNVPIPKFNKAEHSHVIENFYCNLCQVPITDGLSKHCSSCNKCVATFDHHCIWLNNCVGERNYKYFICTLLSAMIGIFVLGLVSVFIILGYFIDIKNGVIIKPYKDFLKNSNSINNLTLFSTNLFLVMYIPVPDVVFLFILLTVIVLAVAALIPIVQLISFHYYLNEHDLTTYEYVKQTRDSSSENSNNAIINPACNNCQKRKFIIKPKNAVVPLNTPIATIQSGERNIQINTSEHVESKMVECISKNENSPNLSSRCQSVKENDMVILTTADQNLNSLVSLNTETIEKNEFNAKLGLSLCTGESPRPYYWKNESNKSPKIPPFCIQPILSETGREPPNKAVVSNIEFQECKNGKIIDNSQSEDLNINWNKPEKRLLSLKDKTNHILNIDKSMDESIDCSLFSTNSTTDMVSNCSTVLDNKDDCGGSITPVPNVIFPLQNINIVSPNLPFNNEIISSKNSNNDGDV